MTSTVLKWTNRKGQLAHKQAGASTTLISSPHQIGMVMDVDHDHSPDELKIFFNHVNVILTEGYKKQNRPKVEIFRSGVHPEPLCAVTTISWPS